MNRSKFAILTTLAAVAFALFLLVVPPYPLSFHDRDAIVLSASLGATSAVQNQTIIVKVNVKNTLPFANELFLNFTSGYVIQNLSMGPCSDSPFGVALLHGRYGVENISSAKTIAIYSPGSYSCGALTISNSFKFGPLQDIGDSVTLAGYWTEGWTNHTGGGISEGVLHLFVPGDYTLVAGDAWGHFKLLYLQVVGLRSTR